MSQLLQKIQNHFDAQLPFVCYCKPNADQLIALFQKDTILYSLDEIESGFAFVSFDAVKKYGIPLKESEQATESFSNFTDFSTSIKEKHWDETAKNKFESLVNKALEQINSNTFDKVVLSRKEVLELPNFSIEKVFSSLLVKYPNSFRYCFYHPQIGFWMGATPEQLMKSSGITMYTVALAGTQLASDNQNVVWAEKEINEQKTVTNFIVDVLQSAGGEVVVSNPYTFQAGAIVHIKTDIQAKFDSVINASNCIELLHPTPAVCGFPKDLAKAFILNNEGYNREYYAGYLGEWNQDGNFDLFVNLRCMKMEINSQNVTASLFIGCGINNRSQPEKEFIETVNKSQTLKSILH